LWEVFEKRDMVKYESITMTQRSNSPHSGSIPIHHVQKFYSARSTAKKSGITFYQGILCRNFMRHYNNEHGIK